MLINKTSFLRFITIIISTTLLTIFANAEEQAIDYNAMFEKANTLYKDGNFESAMELYKKIPEKSAAINYNIGNCAYKLNKLGTAYLYWRRAEKDWGFFGRTELLNNINLLKEKLKEQKSENLDNKTEEILQKFKNLKLHIISFVRAMPLIYFQLVFLIFWIFLFMFIRNLLKSKKRLIISTLFTFIAISGLMLVSKYNFEYKQFGIVITDDAKLLSGPEQNYQVLSFVPEAKEVIIQKSSNGFYKVKINGQMGWISQAAVEKI